jgi:hypothetical protein
MHPRVRELLTLCGSTCVPTNATSAQTERILKLLDDFKVGPADERRMKVYFHDRMADLETAIRALENIKDVKAFQSHLAGAVSVADMALLAFKKLRLDPALRAKAEALVDRKIIPAEQVGQIMDQTQAAGIKAERMLGYLEQVSELAARGVPGTKQVLGDLAKGSGWFHGAEWVLRYLENQGLWGQVQKLEALSEAGGRRWDADIGGGLYQFKNWGAFLDATFLKQILEDFAQTGGFRRRTVRWVFEPRLGPKEAVVKRARQSINDAFANNRTGFSPEVVKVLLDNLDAIIVVP